VLGVLRSVGHGGACEPVGGSFCIHNLPFKTLLGNPCGTPQVGMVENSTSQVGTAQAGGMRVSAAEAGTAQVDTAKIGLSQVQTLYHICFCQEPDEILLATLIQPP
jgi:hypothetical protein